MPESESQPIPARDPEKWRTKKGKSTGIPAKRRIAEGLGFNPDHLSNAQLAAVEKIYNQQNGLSSR